MLRFKPLLQKTMAGWFRQNAALHAAALAYYTLLSLAPLLIFLVVIAGDYFEQSEVEWKLIAGIEKGVGDTAGVFVEDIILRDTSTLSGRVATGFGLLFLLYGASAAFSQLRASLNVLWEVQPEPSTFYQNVGQALRTRLIAVGIVLSISYIFLAWLFVDSLWIALPGRVLRGALGLFRQFFAFAHPWTTPILYIVLFVLIFKLLPKASIRWRDVWPGALLTALLFWLGSYLIGLYLSHSLLASLYGAASSLIVFLVWIYYSTWIILFGAKFTQVYAEMYGVPIEPR